MERPQGTPFPWVVIAGAFVAMLAIIVLKETGASDADTDYLSMVILIAAFALASAMDRRTGLVVAVLAGVIAAIVPGSTSFTHTHIWDSVFRICFLMAMSISFYRVIVALRDREDHLQRQLENVQVLQEEVTALHSLTARAPIDREAIYERIVRAALRLGKGTQSRLLLHAQPDDRWRVVAQWPLWPEHNGWEESARAPGPIDHHPYAVSDGGDGRQCITVPLANGDQITGALQLEHDVAHGRPSEYGELLAVYARDATLTLDHVTLQERLEHLAVMGERGRIARDLHDGLVQSLAGIAFHLEYYRDALGPEATTVRAGFDNMASAVKAALHEARSMIHGLRSEPKSENLAASLADLVDRVAAKTDLTITVNLPEHLPLISDAQASALLHIAHEAFQNIVKHARTDRAWLELAADGDRMTLRIADKGCGFRIPDTDPDAAHFGLIGMAERAAIHGGTLAIDSHIGQGTTVTLSFPVTGRELGA